MPSKTTTTTAKKPKAPKRITITNRAEILKFRDEQARLREADRVKFTVTFKPITDKVWINGGMIDDGTGDNMPATILTSIVQNKPALARIAEEGGSANQVIVHVFDDNDPSKNSDVSWIWLKPESIVSLSYVPPVPPRKISTPRPQSIRVNGLQYDLEITDTDGVRGFKAGCNVVKNADAIKVLEHLADGLGYTVAINPKATMKTPKVKAAPGTSKMLAGA